MMSSALRAMLAGILALGLAIGCERASVKDGAPTSQATAGKEVVKEAHRGPVKVHLRLDRDEVQASETISLTVQVEAERGVETTWPQIGETLSDFGVKEVRDGPSSGDEAVERNAKTYTLEAFLPGVTTIPGMKVAYTDRREAADGSKDVIEDMVETEPIHVTVRQDLADVKGPVSLPWPRSYTLMLWGAGLLAAVLAVALGTRHWAKRRAAQRALAAARPVPAHEWALAELDILASEGLIERGKVQEFYYRINAILRGYIERRWGLMAGEQTSEEFVRALQHSLFFDDGYKQVLRLFVDACDPVKYAKQQPTGDEIAWVQMTARDFVVQTAQRPAPAREAVAA